MWKYGFVMFKNFFIQNNFEFELVIGVSERIVCKYLSVQKIFRILSPRIMAGKNNWMGKYHLIFILTLVSDYTVNLLFLNAAVKFDKF